MVVVRSGVAGINQGPMTFSAGGIALFLPDRDPNTQGRALSDVVKGEPLRHFYTTWSSPYVTRPRVGQLSKGKTSIQRP